MSTFRALERQGNKLTKLGLDLKYFETCLDLNLCPEFLKFRPPKLQVYKHNTEFYQVVVRKKLKEIEREKKAAEFRFNSQKRDILAKLTFLEKSCLISLLTKQFKLFATPYIVTHEKKLLNLWRRQSEKCPECVMNLSDKKLNLREKNALKFGTESPHLTEKSAKR